MKDIEAHMQKRSEVPRVVYGAALVVVLLIVSLLGFYVWKGTVEKQPDPLPSPSRMSDEDAAKLRAEIMAGSAAPMPRESHAKIADELSAEKSEMSDADAARLRAQLFE